MIAKATSGAEMTGAGIKAWREARSLTQAQLAAWLRPPVDQPTVARWESGARRIPAGLWQALERIEQEVRET